MAGLRALGGITEDRLQELITEAVAFSLAMTTLTGECALSETPPSRCKTNYLSSDAPFGQAIYADEMTYNETGKWGSSLLPPGLSDELLRATIAVQQLRYASLIRELSQMRLRGTSGTCTRAMIQNPKTADDAI